MIGYLQQKVSAYYVCIYCNKNFNSLDAVRKHMLAKVCLGHKFSCLSSSLQFAGVFIYVFCLLVIVFLVQFPMINVFIIVKFELMSRTSDVTGKSPKQILWLLQLKDKQTTTSSN